MNLIYQDSGKSIYLDQEAEYGNGEDQPATLPRIERWVFTAQEPPSEDELVVNYEDGDPVSQRIIDKLKDLLQLADVLEASAPADQTNIINQFNLLKGEMPDLIRAAVWSARNLIENR